MWPSACPAPTPAPLDRREDVIEGLARLLAIHVQVAMRKEKRSWNGGCIISYWLVRGTFLEPDYICVVWARHHERELINNRRHGAWIFPFMNF
jgi:hypothetical protein